MAETPTLRCMKCGFETSDGIVAFGHMCHTPPAAPSVGEPTLDDEDDYYRTDARAVLCRVFDDGADEGFDEWLEWYKPEAWLHPSRALGAFIRHRVDRESAALRSSLEEARKDSERLDWLNDTGHEITPTFETDAWRIVDRTLDEVQSPRTYYYGQTIRAAIDAARTPSPRDEP